jgi:lauroyl/myristoyl acyltransferase
VYRLLIRFGRALGLWVVSLFVWFVATGYFLFRPQRVACSLRFYRALAPDRSRWTRLGWTWRQYQGFAALFTERILLRTRPEAIRSTAEGLEHIDEAVQSGRGAVLLMSHVGNWEIAARILAKRCYPLLLYMGTRSGEQVEQEQKSDLQGDGVQVVAIPAGQPDYTAGIEGLKRLREGGLVSVAGDRSFDPFATRLEVTFLGHRVALPQAPHVLALLARAPLIPFFALRTGRRRYHFVAFAGSTVTAAGRAERAAALQRSAQWYAHLLEQVVRKHPTQWYHFEPFLGPPACPATRHRRQGGAEYGTKP